LKVQLNFAYQRKLVVFENKFSSISKIMRLLNQCGR